MEAWLSANIGLLLLALLILNVLFAALLIALLIRVRRDRLAAEQRERESLRAVRDILDGLSRDYMTREEIVQQLQYLSQQIAAQNAELGRNEQERFGGLNERLERFEHVQEGRLSRYTSSLDERLASNENRMDKLREALDQGMTGLRETNDKRLEEMRQTVDEKLHSTLQKRLSESFQVVSSQLEQVAKGLGEMRSLASGVGDLKKVLTNVKTRGIWGEVQLGTLLAQVLTPEQYDENVAVRPDSAQRVEYAIRLPGKQEETLYLPIDSKFPLEAYGRLLDAEESGDADQTLSAAKQLQDAFMTEAKRISGKYIAPPYTTDFAIMFLPTEGLYAEAVRTRGLTEEMQRRYRIVVAGPTTLNALLNSLQIGFRTLAVEQRSLEVWKLLNAVRGDFSRFSELLEVEQSRMRQASESIEKAASRSKTIENKLRAAERLPESPGQALSEENTNTTGA